MPLAKGEDGRLSEKTSGFPRLKKIENRSALHATKSKFSHLPDRKAVDIEFRGLTYSVSEGRRKGETNSGFVVVDLQRRGLSAKNKRVTDSDSHCSHVQIGNNGLNGPG